MKYLAFDMPDTHAERGPWLDAHLVGTELLELVLELAVVHRAARPADSVRAVLGRNLERVLAHGLGALGADDLRPLLIQPYYLLELQSLVLRDGGPYWRSLPESPEVSQRVDQGWRQLSEHLSDAKAPAPPSPATAPRPAPGEARGWRSTLFVLLLNLATGVGVFVACYAYLRWQEAPIVKADPAVWGWNRPDALTPAASPAAYRERLALLLEEWPLVKPEEPITLARRMLELRLGCTRLTFAEHPLPAEQRAALKRQAAEWGSRVNKYLSNLEANAGIDLVRQQVEQFIREVSAELRAEN